MSESFEPAEERPATADGVPEAPRKSLLVQALSFSLLLLLLAVVIALGFTRPAAPPVLGNVPEFRFTDQNGDAFGSEELAGKVWVGDFIFTQCAAACPGMTARFASLQSLIEGRPELAASVRLVSFSVDPERDSPERLLEFANRYGANSAYWSFLTAPIGAVARLSQEAFALAAEPPSAVEPPGEASPRQMNRPTHSDRFVLVDRQGRLRGNYRPTVDEQDLKRLLVDLDAVVGEGAVAD